MTKTPHPHADLIREWALDTSRVVQYLRESGEWADCVSPAAWFITAQYRFKPTPKPDYKTYAKVLNAFLQLDYLGKPNIEFTFDGETHELKDAKVLK